MKQVEMRLARWKSQTQSHNKDGAWVTKAHLRDVRKWTKKLPCIIVVYVVVWFSVHCVVP